jgi:hypothetical protein
MAATRRGLARRAIARRDAMMAIPGMATSLAMLASAGLEAGVGEWNRVAVLGIFGLGLTATTGLDLRTAWAGGPSLMRRRARHIQRMAGAWIASLTAFAVVNLTMLPDPVVWLGPTVLVSPLVTYWTRRHAPEARGIIA